MDSLLLDYYVALERLKARKATINNDTVAIEAGRKKGTIKKSRPLYHELITSIQQAAKEQADASKPADDASEQAKKAKAANKELRQRLDESRAREMSLVLEVFELKKKLAALTGDNVLPIRSNSSYTAN